MIGQVKSINNDKMFGFIRYGTVDYFFHVSAFQGDWKRLVAAVTNGEKIDVEFQEEYSKKGPRATEVRIFE